MGLLEITPKKFEDARGYFSEIESQREFEKQRIPPFVQMNQSYSHKGVLRGMHFQKPPYEQGKLVRCISGQTYDVTVDLRAYSRTYREWKAVVLDSQTQNMLWIPKGFAHGFLALTKPTII